MPKKTEHKPTRTNEPFEWEGEELRKAVRREIKENTKVDLSKPLNKKIVPNDIISIIQYVSFGLEVHDACSKIGIGYDSFYRYLVIWDEEYKLSDMYEKAKKRCFERILHNPEQYLVEKTQKWIEAFPYSNLELAFKYACKCRDEHKWAAVKRFAEYNERYYIQTDANSAQIPADILKDIVESNGSGDKRRARRRAREKAKQEAEETQA